jgi:hypothetical protein
MSSCDVVVRGSGNSFEMFSHRSKVCVDVHDNVTAILTIKPLYIGGQLMCTIIHGSITNLVVRWRGRHRSCESADFDVVIVR